ncbi:MAG: hypothetical protein ACP5IZ_10645 [Thermoprotei archaeon]
MSDKTLENVVRYGLLSIRPLEHTILLSVRLGLEEVHRSLYEKLSVKQIKAFLKNNIDDILLEDIKVALNDEKLRSILKEHDIYCTVVEKIKDEELSLAIKTLERLEVLEKKKQGYKINREKLHALVVRLDHEAKIIKNPYDFL